MNGTQPYSCECVCESDVISTVFSVLGFAVPLIISEILALSKYDANGIVDQILKLYYLN